MKTNSTLFHRFLTLLVLGLVTVFASPQRLEAQCQMACGGTVNVSADPVTCNTIVKPGTMMTQTTSCNLSTYKVKVEYLNLPAILADSIILPSSYIGTKVKVTVMDPATGNSCWGYLNVEDKSAPIVKTLDTTIVIRCFELDKINQKPTFISITDCNNSVDLRPVGAATVITPFDTLGKTAYKTTQVWQAVDTKNNMATSFRVTHVVCGIQKSEIKWPSDTSVSCTGNFAKIPGTSFPMPVVTGFPYILHNGIKINITPNDANLVTNCSVTSSLVDTDVLGKKILRAWKVSCWANGTVVDTNFNQVIFIKDTNLPKITVGAISRSATTSAHNCVARVKLDQLFGITKSDSCSAVTLNAVITSGIAPLAVPVDAFFEAPVGTHTILLTASDVTGNTSTAVITLKVEDKTPPVAVCLETTVSLTNDGTATLPAIHFNNGSKDECGLVNYSVRRMDRRFGCAKDSFDNNFRSEVSFCCNDAASTSPIVVELRVTDEAGNSNTCMINVYVQNKIQPSLLCPAGKELFCDSIVNLDSASLATKFGVPSVTASCGAFTVRHTSFNGRNQCGIGTIRRRWSVFRGGTLVDTCSQIINFIPKPGAEFTVSENEQDTLDDIAWPKKEIEFIGCLNPNAPSLRPDSIGKPVILYSRFGCGMIAMSHKDELFTFNTPLAGSNNACLKILRTWTVVDWCQNNKTWTFNQVIKVVNNTPPTVVSVARDTCLQLETCTGTGRTALTATASDDCSGLLNWTYSIDYNNNGSIDKEVNGDGNSINASNEVFNIGTHRILYTFRDLCGNITTKSHIFNVKNCKTPTPYLIELTLGLTRMNNTGMVTTWASDFNKGSNHPCSNLPLIFAFSRNGSDTGRVYTCANLGTSNVDIYVGVVVGTDTIWNFATTKVTIQDNNTPKACSTTSELVTVRGQLTTEINTNLKGAEVMLEGLDAQMIMTDNKGAFTFTNKETGFNYMVKPKKDDDHDNGVNTLDLLMMQRHILGVNKITSPYKMIAADINNDRKVNILDLLELRKVVLGINTSFSNNTSWRFIDGEHRFTTVEGSLSELFKEVYEINNLQQDMTINFTSVKIGDIDATAAVNANSAITTERSASRLALNYVDRAVNVGEVVTVPLYIDGNKKMAGLQVGISVDQTKADIVEAKLTAPGSSQDMAVVNGNEVRASWIDANGAQLNSVATITVRAKTDTRLSEMMKLSDFTPNAYDSELKQYELELRNKPQVEGQFELYQNVPNPFAANTTITFSLPKDMSAKLSVFDAQGRLVKMINKSFEKGNNTVSIDRSELGISGFYYYTLEAGTYVATKKMVIID